MKISCKECGYKARITTSNRVSPETSQLYCACTNQFCSHSFVMSLGFSHTISAPSKNVDLSMLLKTLSQEQICELKALAGAA